MVDMNDIPRFIFSKNKEEKRDFELGSYEVKISWSGSELLHLSSLIPFQIVLRSV